jgi:hypothetical protein
MDTFRLYISAAADLREERELLAKGLADIPVGLGWVLHQTPVSASETLELEAVTAADLHVLLLAGDVRAPVGVEWLAAWRAQRLPIPYYRAQTTRTPAAAAFFNQVENLSPWTPYSSFIEIREMVFSALIGQLNRRAAHFKLSIDELKRLQEWEQTLKSDAVAEQVDLGGAGASAIVLSPERYEPRDGVLIDVKPQIETQSGNT